VRGTLGNYDVFSKFYGYPSIFQSGLEQWTLWKITKAVIKVGKSIASVFYCRASLFYYYLHYSA